MPEYLVTWKILIDADSPRKAVERALAIQRNTDSLAVVFEVEDDEGITHQIDLLKENDND